LSVFHKEAASDYELTFMQASGLADQRVLNRMKEQQRLLQIQQENYTRNEWKRCETTLEVGEEDVKLHS
jgi:hypothetical protein